MTDALPRVTWLLNHFGLGADLSGIDSEVLARAQERGIAVHQAVSDEAYGHVPPSPSLEVLEYLQGYRLFVKDTGFTVIVSELEVEHPVWKYGGRLDLVGWISTQCVLADIKTGTVVDLAAASLQTVAYREAWSAMRPSRPVINRRLIVQLQPGSYRVHDLEAPGPYPSAAEAWQIFQACLVVYRAQAKAREWSLS